MSIKFRNYSIRPGHLIMCLGSGRGRHNIRHVFGILGKSFFLGYLKAEPINPAPAERPPTPEESAVWKAFDQTFEKMDEVFKKMKP